MDAISETLFTNSDRLPLTEAQLIQATLQAAIMRLDEVVRTLRCLNDHDPGLVASALNENGLSTRLAQINRFARRNQPDVADHEPSITRRIIALTRSIDWSTGHGKSGQLGCD